MADEAHRAAVTCAQRPAVMLRGEQVVRLEEVVDEQVGRVVAVAVQHDRRGCAVEVRGERIPESGDRNAVPAVVEAGPGGDTVEVTRRLMRAQGVETLPVELDRFCQPDTPDAQAPVIGRDVRCGAVGQHREPFGEELPGRKPRRILRVSHATHWAKPPEHPI